MISVICPAKLNLGLKVLGRRPDGFHELRGLMVAIPWFDRLDVDVEFLSEGTGVPVVELKVTADPDGESGEAPRGEQNIVVRAARAYLEEFGATRLPGRPLVSIRLKKTVPSGTGLGGASSDAAGTLLALDDLMAEAGLDRMGKAGIRSIAARLGSDVVFFLEPVPAMIVGRGEEFVPARNPVDLAVVVAVPVKRLSTGDVFAAWDASRIHRFESGNALTARGDSDISPCLSVSAPAAGGSALSPEMFENDLSDAVFELCPRSADLARFLTDSGARLSAVTGSGAAVYGVCDDIGSARACAAAMARFLEPGEIVRAFQVGMVF